MVNKYVILHICQNLHILHCVSFYTESQGGVQAFAPEAPSLLLLGVAPPTMMNTILILFLVDLHTSMLCPSVCSVFLVPVHSWFLHCNALYLWTCIVFKCPFTITATHDVFNNAGILHSFIYLFIYIFWCVFAHFHSYISSYDLWVVKWAFLYNLLSFLLGRIQYYAISKCFHWGCVAAKCFSCLKTVNLRLWCQLSFVNERGQSSSVDANI